MKILNLDAALVAGMQMHLDRPALPVWKYSGHPDTADPSSSRLYQMLRLPHHQWIHPRVHTGQCHKPQCAENVNPIPTMRQMETQAAFLIIKVLALDTPTEYHHLMVFSQLTHNDSPT